ncbi:hypothetical protein [Citrobacter sp. BDA59-3]|uniref:hypothetical protein n=1 Tax=Citrobacter sp. BDA59-3 TaxID=2781952 RepID=UPI0018803584|nr:hypothetical protein [Citrobacter sp. BDA59-3]QOV66750.1 hypothetical protein IP582_13725 [Citrobacter sp. BDA59-3]
MFLLLENIILQGSSLTENPERKKWKSRGLREPEQREKDYSAERQCCSPESRKTEEVRRGKPEMNVLNRLSIKLQYPHIASHRGGTIVLSSKTRPISTTGPVFPQILFTSLPVLTGLWKWYHSRR